MRFFFARIVPGMFDNCLQKFTEPLRNLRYAAHTGWNISWYQLLSASPRLCVGHRFCLATDVVMLLKFRARLFARQPVISLPAIKNIFDALEGA